MFILLNWTLCILTSLLLIYIFIRVKYLFIKPSVVFILFFHVMIQWASTVNASDIESFLPNPWVFLLLSQIFPLGSLLLSITFNKNIARSVYQDIQISNKTIDKNFLVTSLKWLFFLIIIIVLLYLREVPLSQTGLYTIFTDSSRSAEARELSLKLVGNPVVKYSYSIMTKSAAPLATIILFVLIQYFYRRKNIISVLFYVVLVVFIMVVSSLSGARSHSALIILSMLIAFVFQKDLRVSLLKILFGGIIVLMIPTLLTLMREGRDVNLDNLIVYLSGGIFRRTFYVPMEVGLYHVHYTQTVGTMGVAAFSKLASFFAIEPINPANLIGRMYSNSRLDSVFANTSFVFSYYAYFGIISFFVNFFLLGLLDSSLYFYKLVRLPLLLPLVAVISIISISFVSSDFTTCLITHGFLPTLVVVWWLSILVKKKSDNA